MAETRRNKNLELNIYREGEKLSHLERNWKNIGESLKLMINISKELREYLKKCLSAPDVEIDIL